MSEVDKVIEAVMRNTKRIAIGLVALLAIVLFFVIAGGLGQPIADGTYEGQTIDYSHQRGLIFQTNDLTTKTHERSSQREDWCVPDNEPQLVKKVRSIPTGSEVKIDYHQQFWIYPDVCPGNQKIIDSIEVVNASTGGN